MSFILTKGVLQQQANRAGGQQYALEFDGEDDYVEIPFIGAYDIPNNFTVELKILINDTSLNTQRLFHLNRRFTITTRYQQDWGTGFYNYGKDGWQYSGYFVPENEFVNIAVVKDDTFGVRFYIEGELYETTSNTSSVGNSTENLFLGLDEDKDSFPLSGIISDVRYWDYIRTESQIQNNLNKTLSGSESGLIYYPDFSKGSGDTLPDKTQYGNHGTIYGAKWIQL